MVRATVWGPGASILPAWLVQPPEVWTRTASPGTQEEPKGSSHHGPWMGPGILTSLSHTPLHPTPSLQDLTDAGNLGRAGCALASLCPEALSFNEATDTPQGPAVWLAQEWGGGSALGEGEGQALPTSPPPSLLLVEKDKG